MTSKPASRTADQFVLRLPDGMRDRIAELAKKNGRSMNAEIVHRLEESFAGEVLSPLDQEIMRDAFNRALRDAIASGIVRPRLKANGEPIDDKTD